MARQKFEKSFNTFVKGLMTEASEINFPENYSLYEKNFELRRDGGRDRRKGMDLLYPLGVTLTSKLYPIESEDTLAPSVLAPALAWSTPPMDTISVNMLPPVVKVTTSVRYLEYNNAEPELLSVVALPPSVKVTTQVRYLTYDDGEPESLEVAVLPPVVKITTAAGYVDYTVEPESLSVAVLAPTVKVTTQ